MEIDDPEKIYSISTEDFLLDKQLEVILKNQLVKCDTCDYKLKSKCYCSNGIINDKKPTLCLKCFGCGIKFYEGKDCKTCENTGKYYKDFNYKVNLKDVINVTNKTLCIAGKNFKINLTPHHDFEMMIDDKKQISLLFKHWITQKQFIEKTWSYNIDFLVKLKVEPKLLLSNKHHYNLGVYRGYTFILHLIV